MTRTLVEHACFGQRCETKGALRQYRGKTTGLSRAQVTRLIGRYHESGTVKERGYRRHRFVRPYTPADIGLPPGGDVDRQSLQKAAEASGWAFSHYDILPDRLVVYIWPRAGTTPFSFQFRPRFAMQAKTAASVLYDYYNPEARVVVQPAEFRVE